MDRILGKGENDKGTMGYGMNSDSYKNNNNYNNNRSNNHNRSNNQLDNKNSR